MLKNQFFLETSYVMGQPAIIFFSFLFKPPFDHFNSYESKCNFWDQSQLWKFTYLEILYI